MFYFRVMVLDEVEFMSDVSSAVGLLVAQGRTVLGITQADLAHALGVSRQTISNIERGATSVPTTRVLSGLARELGIDLPTLLGEAAMSPSGAGAGKRPAVDELPLVQQRRTGMLTIKWANAFPLTERERSALARLLAAQFALLRDTGTERRPRFP